MKIISYGVSVALMVLLMVALNASGEYYQYTDSNGSARFTDDPSLIPTEQRTEARVYESIVSYPQDPEAPLISTEDKEVTSPADDVDMESVDKKNPIPSSGSTDQIEVTELNAIREQLKKAYKELEAAKKSEPPPENSKSGTMGDYVQMSRELNQKIEAYNQVSKKFEEKVKAFNSRITKK